MDDSLPLSVKLRVEEVCTRFEAAWQAAGPHGAPPRIEDCLAGTTERERQALLWELLLLDVYYRRQRGERPGDADYAAYFPEENDLIQGALAAARPLRRPPLVPESSRATLRPSAGAATMPDPNRRGPAEGPVQTAAAEPSYPAVPGYEVLGELGRGGMGVVYRAQQAALKRVVALKMVLSGDLASAQELARFRSEAEAVARLQHPNIVQIHEVGEYDGRPFFSLEYVGGGTLATKVRASLPDPKEAAALIEQLARAMHAVHRCDVVHRDLKPANVLLAADGTPKVADFGLAKRLDGDSGQTHTGRIMGTPSYMAPEQAGGHGKKVGPAADVYSLGAILYECLTGRPPFRAATVLDTLNQVRHDDPVPPRGLNPAVPRDLETACLKCLQKDPAKRYLSAAELADDLRRYQAGEPIRARPVGAVERAGKWVNRNRIVSALCATVVLVVIIGLAGTVSQYAKVLDRESALKDNVEQLGIAITKKDEALTGERNALRDMTNALHAETAAKFEAKRQEKLALERLSRSRQNALTAQLIRVKGIWTSDPVQGLSLLEDLEACPLDLRDFPWRLYFRNCRRELRLFRRHTVSVMSLAFLGDSPLLVSVGRVNRRGAVSDFSLELKLWNSSTGQRVSEFMAEDIWRFALSPGGENLATIPMDRRNPKHPQGVQIWDTVAHKETIRLRVPGEINVLSFAPDGKVLAAACKDQTVRLWDVVSDKELATLKHPAQLNCMVFRGDGKVLATGSRDGTVRLWDPNKAKDVTVFKVREANGITALAFSRDGKTLAGGGGSGVVVLWDVESGKEIGALPWHLGSITALAFGPDGKRLAVGSAGTSVGLRDGKVPVPTGDVDDLGEVKLWGLDPISDGTALTGHTAGVNCLVFSPEGTRLASGADDFTVRLWDPGPRPVSTALEGHEAVVSAVAFSKDGKTVASGSWDRTVRLWDAATRKERALLRGHKGPVQSLAFNSAGTVLATADQNRVVILWDPATGTVLATLEGAGGEVAFSPDGQTLASVRGDGLRLWDVRTMKERGPARWQHMLVNSVAYSPDGKTLALGNEDDGTVMLWDVQKGEQVGAVNAYEAGGGFLRFSPDGKTLAYSGVDRSVRLWDTATRAERAILKGATAPFAFSSDSKTLASGSAGQPGRPSSELRLWDVSAGQERGALEHPSSVSAVAFGADGKILASANDLEKSITLWEAYDGPELTTVRDARGPVAYSPDGKTLASASSGRVILRDAATGQERNVLRGHSTPVTCVAFSRDSKTLISGSVQEDWWVGQHRRLPSEVWLWDVGQGEERGAHMVFADPVYSVALTADGKTALAGHLSGSISVWDVSTGKELPPLKGHNGPVNSLVPAPDGRTVASASSDKTLRLWDVAEGKEVAVLEGDIGEINAVAFSADGRSLASAGENGALLLWDVTTRRPLARLSGSQGAIFCVAFSPDGKTLASGGADQLVRVWDVGTRRLRAALSGHTVPVMSVSFAADGNVLASGSGFPGHPRALSGAGEVTLWDVSDRPGPEDKSKPRTGD
jgi:WD40 repeat protein